MKNLLAQGAYVILRNGSEGKVEQDVIRLNSGQFTIETTSYNSELCSTLYSEYDIIYVNSNHEAWGFWFYQR